MFDSLHVLTPFLYRFLHRNFFTFLFVSLHTPMTHAVDRSVFSLHLSLYLSPFTCLSTCLASPVSLWPYSTSIRHESFYLFIPLLFFFLFLPVLFFSLFPLMPNPFHSSINLPSPPPFHLLPPAFRRPYPSTPAWPVSHSLSFFTLLN